VSVIVPFGGPASAAGRVRDRLGRLELIPGDELLLVDNTADQEVESVPGAGIRLVRAPRERSSYYARNVGADAAGNDWLLFVDSDCRPSATLLDDYFEAEVDPRCGILAGSVEAAPDQDATVARYARARGHLDESFHLDAEPHPAGITANLMVRREVWDSLGGFHEGVKSGADIEFCWRAQDAGWTLTHVSAARVEHLHVETLAELVRKTSRHAAGRLWAARLHPGAFERPRLLRPLVRCAGGALVWTMRGDREQATFKLLDAVWTATDVWGYTLGDNRAVRPDPDTSGQAPAGGRHLCVITDAFPARSETFVYNELRELSELGWRVRVESAARSARPERGVAREVEIAYLGDDPPPRKLRDLGWLILRHPIRCLGDLAARRRWRHEEEVWPLAALAPATRRIARSPAGWLHAHFAAGAALHTLRIARLLGKPYSITAHAYELYQRPRNLHDKLGRAAFVAGECDYTVAHMRGLVDEPDKRRIRRVRTGVDPERFRRSSTYPGGRTAVAIGRLIEKKGFRYVVEAMASDRDGGPERLVIAGDGPLRPALERQVRDLELEDAVELRGNVWGAEAVRELLEGADVLVVPSVIAADGDRDALPVVVYEALAMEVPVVASRLVGLPEAVRQPWGRLVPPGDADALAETLAELLAIPASERRAMGTAGRDFVVEQASTRSEAERLVSLIAEAGGS
jgi:glycosyltransferase involved in cell wall biosynthesis/GT2 family glycosyltransferase